VFKLCVDMRNPFDWQSVALLLSHWLCLYLDVARLGLSRHDVVVASASRCANNSLFQISHAYILAINWTSGQDVPEYYCTGHDQVEALTELLGVKATEKLNLSFSSPAADMDATSVPRSPQWPTRTLRCRG
jgi:hypothetical protein